MKIKINYLENIIKLKDNNVLTIEIENKKYVLKDIIKIFVKNTLDSLENPNKYKEFSIYEG